MKPSLILGFIVCILFSCLFASAQHQSAGVLGEFPDTPNNGGFTQTQQIPSDNNGGFTSDIVSQQEIVPNQPVSGNAGSNSWGTPGSSYLTQKPTDYGQLSDTGTAPGFGAQTPAGGQSGPNGLWIVDSTGLNRYPEMSVPLNGYAREEITPSVEGQITIEEMYPDGKVRTFGMGYVRSYHVYKMWFFGDVPGTHMIRYNINGYYSNIVRFYVQGSASQGQTNPVAGVGSTVSRTGSTIIRSGGSYGSSSSGYSSMSSSEGSMSISSSFG